MLSAGQRPESKQPLLGRVTRKGIPPGPVGHPSETCAAQEPGGRFGPHPPPLSLCGTEGWNQRGSWEPVRGGDRRDLRPGSDGRAPGGYNGQRGTVPAPAGRRRRGWVAVLRPHPAYPASPLPPAFEPCCLVALRVRGSPFSRYFHRPGVGGSLCLLRLLLLRLLLHSLSHPGPWSCPEEPIHRPRAVPRSGSSLLH